MIISKLLQDTQLSILSVVKGSSHILNMLLSNRFQPTKYKYVGGGIMFGVSPFGRLDKVFLTSHVNIYRHLQRNDY